MVSKVLKSEAKDKHKFNTAMTFCRDRLNQFRSDEKRKVGHGHHSCFLMTNEKINAGFGYRTV